MQQEKGYAWEVHQYGLYDRIPEIEPVVEEGDEEAKWEWIERQFINIDKKDYHRMQLEGIEHS
ncbi:hypothetical protein DPMN_114590 [Dreissena polymorpha]|uniref:Uncharacterized protein n=1 Tax=Dreissena polymorpha TaxID=45954 RepID=A0A9D4KJR2_DREPO|nr:hypothetical protein DPMN_114590 [Dreissena polymorpha]